MDTREDRLRFVIKEFFGNQRAVAGYLEVAQPTVSAYLNGAIKIDLDLIDKLKVFGVNPYWLLEGKCSVFADSPAGEALRAAMLEKYKDKDYLPKYLVDEH